MLNAENYTAKTDVHLVSYKGHKLLQDIFMQNQLITVMKQSFLTQSKKICFFFRTLALDNISYFLRFHCSTAKCISMMERKTLQNKVLNNSGQI